MEAEVILVLRVADADAAVGWYERLGFLRSGNIASSRAALRSCRSRVTGRGCSCPSTEAMPGRRSLVHLYVSDVDAVVAEFGRPHGDPPYGCELELRDPDGNRLRIARLAS